MPPRGEAASAAKAAASVDLSRFRYEDAFSRNLGWVTAGEQQILRGKRAAIAGLGGVGGSHLLTLTRLGIGAFNIADFEPRVGSFHLPPPVHQTFEGDGFVVCSFCPRPFDFDSQGVPAPYNHSNVMSDEVLYYANSEFMSRKGIEYGSVTLHPDGIPHGPHPGRTEESIGKPQTNELAVMMDTFRPLQVALPALGIEDPSYYRSWVEDGGAHPLTGGL